MKVNRESWRALGVLLGAIVTVGITATASWSLDCTRYPCPPFETKREAAETAQSIIDQKLPWSTSEQQGMDCGAYVVRVLGLGPGGERPNPGNVNYTWLGSAESVLRPSGAVRQVRPDPSDPYYLAVFRSNVAVDAGGLGHTGLIESIDAAGNIVTLESSGNPGVSNPNGGPDRHHRTLQGLINDPHRYEIGIRKGWSTAPEAQFAARPVSSGIATMRFEALPSRADNGRRIVKYVWDFGDGRTQTGGPVVTHEYARPGWLDVWWFNVKLTVTDDAGGTGSVTQLVFPPSVVAAVAAKDNKGYFFLRSDGQVLVKGSARSVGSMFGIRTVAPFVAMARTASGKGYWLAGADGGVFAFGDAKFYGSMGGKPLNKPIVGMAATKTGKGYWLVASDGGVFSFGDAKFYGSMGGKPLNKPIVAMGRSASGKGYVLVASDGGVFAFGDAPFLGSMGGKPLNAPIQTLRMTSTGKGYWLFAQDGGVFAFGDAPFKGTP